MDFFKHDTVIIDDGARIGSGTKIWHWSHVCAKAVIGTNCILGQNVYVGNNVVIGNNVKVQNNVSVYDNVTLEDDVFCGPSVVFTNVINPRAFLERKNEFKDTLIKKGATLGANSTVVCGITIGEYAFIGAGAVVTKNIAAFALVTGVPGKQTGWITRFGEKMDLPLNGYGSFVCTATKDVYILNGYSMSLKIHDEYLIN